MPSITFRATPTAVSKSSSYKKERIVGFNKDPVSDISRPVNVDESWAVHHFETHAHKCVYCNDPYEVHRSHGQLCEVGHRLAQEVAQFLYQHTDGKTYSTEGDNNKPVQVEIPAGYVQVRSLLRAMERSLRYRSRTPFVSMDRTYYVAARLPTRSRSVKLEQEHKPKARPRSGEIVDWPASTSTPKPKPQAKVTVEVNNSASKRGSLYEQDIAMQRRNAKQYKVEVREPMRHERLSGYYR